MAGGGDCRHPIPSAQSSLDGGWDTTHGIHGHARARRGLKKAANDVRRCHERDLIRKIMAEIEDA